MLNCWVLCRIAGYCAITERSFCSWCSQENIHFFTIYQRAVCDAAGEPDKQKKAAAAAFLKRAIELSICDRSLGTDSAEFLAELVNAASGVDDFVLTGVERMRFRRNFNLHQRIFFTFVSDVFASLDCRTGDELEIVRNVVEQDFAVIWVNAVFHNCLN
jgi:hypothetical protein